MSFSMLPTKAPLVAPFGLVLPEVPEEAVEPGVVVFGNVGVDTEGAIGTIGSVGDVAEAGVFVAADAGVVAGAGVVTGAADSATAVWVVAGAGSPSAGGSAGASPCVGSVGTFNSSIGWIPPAGGGVGAGVAGVGVCCTGAGAAGCSATASKPPAMSHGTISQPM